MNQAAQRGVQAANARRPAEAARWFAEAARQEPGNVQLRAWLGQALCASGAHRDGVVQLAGAALALARDPHPATRAKAIDLAAALQALTALDPAIEALAAVIAAEPNNARARYLHAVALAQVNRPAEALAAAREAARLAPDHDGVAVLLASVEIDAGLDDAAAARLDALLARAPAPREAHRAHKERARLYDRAGDPDAAFAALDAAAAAARAVPELAALDRALIPRRIDEAMAGHSAEAMARWRGHDFGDRAAPMFVMGFYRSGTTLTQQVLAAHPDLFVADEAGLMGAVERALDALVPGAMPVAAKLATLDADGIARLRAAYWAAVRGRFGDAAEGKRFVDKFTMSVVDLGLINTIFPDGALVFLLRDPRDACLSAYQQLMPPSAATAHLLDWQDAAAFYARVMDWWLVARDRSAMARVELRYEDMVVDLAGSFAPVLALLDLSWDARMDRFHERAAGRFISTPSRSQVARPLYTGAVARWRGYERHFAPVMPVLARFVAAFGYDPA